MKLIYMEVTLRYMSALGISREELQEIIHSGEGKSISIDKDQPPISYLVIK